MKYKALFLDLDGTTILNGIASLPSPRVADVIRRAKDTTYICLVTGRPLFLSKNIIEHLEVSALCVTTGGAQIYNPVSKEIIKEVPLSQRTVKEIIEIGKKYAFDFGIINNTEYISYKHSTSMEKVLMIDFPSIPYDMVLDVETRLKQIPNISVHKMPSWENGYMSLDVADIKATKYHGITEVQKYLHTRIDETIGVGDSTDDISLFEACGFTVAVGNAVSELKAIADFIAPSVEDDGVAVVIEKFILQ